MDREGCHQSENSEVWIRIEDTKFKKIKIARSYFLLETKSCVGSSPVSNEQPELFRQSLNTFSSLPRKGGVAKTVGLREGRSPLGFKTQKRSFFRLV